MTIDNSKLIFIVEDDPFYKEIISSHLFDLGYTKIELYTNAKDFLNNLYKIPDIIFLDYNLEDKNGLEILKEIKGFNPDIHVVFLSAQDTIQVAVDALRFGALDYIIKNDVALEKINFVLVNISNLESIIKKHTQKSKNIIKILLTLFLATIVLSSILILK